MLTDQAVSMESREFTIEVGGTDLKFRAANLNDPVPSARQIIAAAGGHPVEEFIVIAWSKDGDLAEIDLDDSTDLRGLGPERFIVAKSDRTFRFEIDSRRHEWPERQISREALLAIAGQDTEKFSVWQELRKKADEEILAGQSASLDPEGVERFYTVLKHTTEGLK